LHFTSIFGVCDSVRSIFSNEIKDLEAFFHQEKGEKMF